MDARIAERRAAVQHHRRQRRHRMLLSLAVFLALVGGGVAAMMSPLFLIDEVAVIGAPSNRVDEVREVVDIAPGDNLALADVATGAESVRELPWAAEAQVTRAPPAAVEVTVQPREPAAVVRLENSAWTVDPEGVVLAGGVIDEDAVRIDAPNSVLPSLGADVSDPAVRNALAFHAALPADVAERVDRYEAPSERELRLRIAWPTGQRVWVRVGPADDVELKAEVIEALLAESAEQFAAGDSAVEELDVRVPSNPVLVPGEDAPVPGEDAPVPGQDAPVPGQDAPVPGEDAP